MPPLKPWRPGACRDIHSVPLVSRARRIDHRISSPRPTVIVKEPAKTLPDKSIEVDF